MSSGSEIIYEFLRPLRTTTKKMLAEGLRDGFKVEVKCPPDFYSDVEVVTQFLPGAVPTDPIRTQIYKPKNPNPPIVLYIHGGGWSMEQSDDYLMMLKKISAISGVMIVAINYRLAPENPFPAGLEDCLAAFRWLRAHGKEIGGNPGQIVIGGDSAGGNFTFALTLKLKQEKETLPQGLFGLCPLTDMIFENYPSWVKLANNNFIYDAAFAGFIRGAYANCDQWTHPFVSPMYGELSGLPPSFVIGGTEDPLVDDNRAFARKLKEAGVETELHVHEGMPHAFYCFTGLIPEEGQALDQLKIFLQRIVK